MTDGRWGLSLYAVRRGSPLFWAVTARYTRNMNTKTLVSLFLLVLVIGAVLLFRPRTTVLPDRSDTATTTRTLVADPALGTAYRVDPAQSALIWRGTKKIGEAHEGVISLQEGLIIADGDSVVEATFIVDVDSLSTTDLSGAAKTQLDDHLRAAEYFDTATYPTARLVITEATVSDPTGEDNVTLRGNLTIKDQTHGIEFPATVTRLEDRLTAHAAFSIDRTVWGITAGSENFFADLGDRVINDEIELMVTIVAFRE